MKKVVSVILSALLLFGLTAVMASATIYEYNGYYAENEKLEGVLSGYTRYEAEDAEIYGSNKKPGVEGGGPIPGTESQSFYSGGLAAAGFDSNVDEKYGAHSLATVDFAAGNIPYVKFTVNAAAAGTTTVTLATNGGDPNASVIVEVNGSKQKVDLPVGDNNMWNRMSTQTFEVTLKAGANTIYISRSIPTDESEKEGPWRNIDFIDVKDISSAPVTDPTTAPTDDNNDPTDPTDESDPTGDTTTTTDDGIIDVDPNATVTTNTTNTTTTTNAQDANTDPDDNGGSLTWLWFVIGGVVVLAGAGVAVYFLYFKKKKA